MKTALKILGIYLVVQFLAALIRGLITPMLVPVAIMLTLLVVARMA